MYLNLAQTKVFQVPTNSISVDSMGPLVKRLYTVGCEQDEVVQNFPGWFRDQLESAVLRLGRDLRNGGA